ncbi:MAG: 50S ribosomal protein L3 [Magnetococcales bacterium]|nr:50S ribosomal protein L3 [Magnetococcales bacterium]MBF0419176.1 50S ribosomal protein L3 [Magnetococcales bacterium]MBF0434999.1 50S ribosomal protein L3 [Magnetococcales bacterium]
MAPGLIGRKVGMTRIFTEEGLSQPVTLVKAGPCPVVSVKEMAKDGYNAVQLGFEDVKPSRLSKAVRGVFAKANVPVKKVLREFRVEGVGEFTIGQVLTLEQFPVDGYVDITGKGIGKGFAGVMKRWGFAGGNATHGAHRIHRSPGSIGQNQSPGRVYKNKKMAGHMGDSTVTMQNLKVAAVDLENHLLVIKGSIPGSKGSLVLIKRATKKT